MALDYRAIEQFLFREARLADENAYDEWYALWDDHEETVYWVPCNHDDVDPERELSIIYDNMGRLNLRLKRVQSGMAWTQEPKSRVRRILGNIEISETSDGLIEVGANFQATEVRVNVNTPFFWHGRYIYHLRPEGDDFKIRLKKVLLLNNDQEMTQLTFLV